MSICTRDIDNSALVGLEYIHAENWCDCLVEDDHFGEILVEISPVNALDIEVSVLFMATNATRCPEDAMACITDANGTGPVSWTENQAILQDSPLCYSYGILPPIGLHAKVLEVEVSSGYSILAGGGDHGGNGDGRGGGWRK